MKLILFTVWPPVIVLLMVAWYYRYNICFAFLWVLALFTHREREKEVNEPELDLTENFYHDIYG